jgi:hypothetical protein
VPGDNNHVCLRSDNAYSRSKAEQSRQINSALKQGLRQAETPLAQPMF